MTQRHAFSLLELSVVIAIIALVTGAVLASGDMIDRTRLQDTKNRLDDVQKAIENFTTINRRLPCVGKLSTASDAYDEISDDCVTLGTTIPSGTYRFEDGLGNFIRLGGIPTTILGIPESYALDGYGNKILYATTESLTVADADFATGGVIAVKTDSGAAYTDQGAYIILSHGPDEIGGFSKSGAGLTACDSSRADAENCNNYSSSNDENIFISDVFQPSDIDANHFDDIVRWGSPIHFSAKHYDAADCPVTQVHWTVGVNDCSGPTTRTADGSSITVADTVIADEADFECKNGRWILSADPAADCSP